MTQVIELSKENEMAKAVDEKTPSQPFLKTLWQIAAAFLGNVKPLFHQLQGDLEKRLDHYAQVIEKRLMVLVFRGATLFISVLFVGFGLLFVLMDNGGVSRGIACLCCGLFGAAVLLVSIQLKIKSEAS
jgi:hypothetical protein